ncbi:MAG: hypothetical protein RL732_1510 [Bacteroidota bacterium]
MDSSYLFYLLLLVVAFLYASVGHGGASGYLAIMALFGMAPDIMKPTALLLNLFVSLTAFIFYYRQGYFNWKLFIPLAVASVPMAFIGGMIHLDAVLYRKVLGFLLLIPVARFLFYPNAKEIRPVQNYWAGAIFMGAAIGFLSGLIGIGGGILLSPLLLLLSWSDQKQTAAISSLFIFVNSLSGFGGQLSQGLVLESQMITYVAFAFTGGLVGAWFGALHFRQEVLKYILGVVLLVASLKLLAT